MTGRPHLHTCTTLSLLAPPVTADRIHWYRTCWAPWETSSQASFTDAQITRSVGCRGCRGFGKWIQRRMLLRPVRLARSLRRTASRLLALHRRDKDFSAPPSLPPIVPAASSPNQQLVSQIPQSMRKVRLALLRRTLSGTSTLGGFRSPPQSTQTAQSVLREVQTCRPLPNGRSARFRTARLARVALGGPMTLDACQQDLPCVPKATPRDP